MKRENIKLAKHRKEKKNPNWNILLSAFLTYPSQKQQRTAKKKVQGIKDETNC